MCSTADADNDPRTVANLTKQYLTCFICKKIFKEPRTLPCFHSFCNDCLTNWKKTTCPKCEVPFDTNHKKTGTSKIIAGVMKLHQVIEISGGDPWHKPCGICNKTSSIFCKECNFFSCSECFSEIHEKWKPLDDHHTVNFNKMTTVIKVCGPVIGDDSRPIKCSFHKDELLEFYCNSCQVIVCSSCKSQHHKDRDHDVQRISNFYDAQFKRTIIDYVEQRTVTIRKNKQKIEKRIKEIESEGEKLENDIRLKLKQLEMDLLGEVRGLVKVKVDRLKVQIEMTNKESDSLTEYRKTRRKIEKFEFKTAKNFNEWETQYLKTYESSEEVKVSRETKSISYSDTPVERADLMVKLNIPSVKTILKKNEE